jgi:hypothetical protein
MDSTLAAHIHAVVAAGLRPDLAGPPGARSPGALRLLKRIPGARLPFGLPFGLPSGWGGLPRYWCLNTGLRFSAKAPMPSRWSSVPNSEWNMRRSNSTPSVRPDS